jgi:hypothetical protein
VGDVSSDELRHGACGGDTAATDGLKELRSCCGSISGVLEHPQQRCPRLGGARRLASGAEYCQSSAVRAGRIQKRIKALVGKPHSRHAGTCGSVLCCAEKPSIRSQLDDMDPWRDSAAATLSLNEPRLHLGVSL